MSELSMSMFATREDYEAAKKAAMGDVKLPELPKPANEADSDDCTYACPEGFDADQMREYARAAVLAERERCAKLLEPQYYNEPYGEGYRQLEPEQIAAAIRKGNAGVSLSQEGKRDA
jgi:hypothetical protein